MLASPRQPWLKILNRKILIWARDPYVACSRPRGHCVSHTDCPVGVRPKPTRGSLPAEELSSLHLGMYTLTCGLGPCVDFIGFCVYSSGMRASDKAYSALREDIIEWRLLPGAVLAEVEQSERLGVSRTPIREALSRLTAEGLARTAGRRGVVVSAISLADVNELFELRETLECRASALAAQRGNPTIFAALHDELAAAPTLLSSADPARHEYYALVGKLDEAIDLAICNSYLAQAMSSLRVHLVRIRRLAADDAVRLIAAAEEHAAIAGAIAAGNPRLAEAATILHLHRSLAHIKATHTPR